MSNKYKFEEISEEDGGMLTLGNDELRLLIAKSLSTVPKKVADSVLTSCVFIMPMNYYEYGLFIPKTFPLLLNISLLFHTIPSHLTINLNENN